MQTINAFSWKLVSDFNTLPSLFQDQNLPYTVETYVCDCSHIKMVRSYKEENKEETYICEVCENNYFEDANAFLKESAWFSRIETLFPLEMLQSLEPRISTNPVTKEMTLYMAIDIPSNIDYVREKVYFAERKIFEISLSFDGIVSQNVLADFGLEDYYNDAIENYHFYEPVSDEILIDHNKLLHLYKSKMLDFLKLHPHFKQDVCVAQSQSLNDVVFFIRYPHLRESAFLKWKYPELLPKDTPLNVKDALLWVANHRPEEYLKKAIFEHHDMCMKHDKPFNHLLMRALTMHMHDANCAAKLVHLDLDISEDGSRSAASHCAYLWTLFVSFLTSIFSDKQVSILLHSFEKKERSWLISIMEVLHEVVARPKDPQDGPIEPHTMTHNQRLHFNFFFLHEFKLAKIDLFPEEHTQDNKLSEAQNKALDIWYQQYSNLQSSMDNYDKI